MHKLIKHRYIFFWLFVIFALITAYANFLKFNQLLTCPHTKEEKFDSSFLSVNTEAKFDTLIFERFRKTNHDTAATVLFLDTFLRKRFYNGYSVLSKEQNWIALCLGKLVWSHFQFPVIPNDILLHPSAACSQQGILFQDALDKLKIPCAVIKFYPLSKYTAGHYAISAFYTNSYHFFDPNKEPMIVDSSMPSIETIVDKKLYVKMYSKPSNMDFQAFFQKKSFARVTQTPFTIGNMYYFQSITAALSKWLWLFFILVYAILSLKSFSKQA